MGRHVRRDRGSAALCALPERLLLILLWVCVAVAGCTVAGQFRGYVVVPVAVVLVAATWRWRPAPGDRAPGDVLATIGCLLLLAVWVGVQLPLTAERLIVTRDPDVYTLTALWLVDHASPAIAVPDGSAGVLGFDLTGGALRPQGNHLVPALSATVGWVAGTAGVLSAGLLWGAAGLLALFALGRRVVGPRWALLAPAALALSLPLLETSRALYSEPLSMALTLLAGSLLVAAWRSGRSGDFLLCGVALGAVSLTRVDGALVTFGVVAGLTALAVLTGRADVAGRRWASLLVAAGAAPLIALGVLDLALYTGIYYDNSRPTLIAIGTALLTATAGSAALAGLTGRTRRASPQRLSTAAGRLAPFGAAVLVAVWAVLASRPLWLSAEGTAPSPLVATLQAAAGVAVEPRRSYDELTLNWLSWYSGVVPVALGLLVLAAWLLIGLRDPRRSELACLLLLVLPSTLLYLWSPLITPDQVWAVRRFLPVVLPALLLATAWGLRELARWRGPALPLRQVAAGLLAVATLAWPLSTLPGLWTVRDKGGTLAGIRQVCQQVAGRPAVVTGTDPLLPTVLIGCGVPAYALLAPTPARLAEAHRSLGGGDIALVTRDPARLTFVGPAPTPIDVLSTGWETTLLRRPATGAGSGTFIVVADVDGEGAVRAAPRR